MGQTPHGTTMAAADTSSEVAKKLKESFKGQVSNHVIKYLSAYRKPDCKVGKITNNEDFKHLARKVSPPLGWTSPPSRGLLSLRSLLFF